MSLTGVDQARFIADQTLNRVCRYLRLLGIDCTLETDTEHSIRCDITRRGGASRLADDNNPPFIS